MPLIYQHRIHRVDLKSNPQILYAFGDNMARDGYGGQAKEMRGESNAVGIATKWRPDNGPGAFFSDHQAPHLIPVIDADMQVLIDALAAGRTVVWPIDGVGTGLSRLPDCAPRIWDYLCTKIRQMNAVAAQPVMPAGTLAPAAPAVLFEVMARAAAMDQLEDACRLIQDALGQDDGGLAGMLFSTADITAWPGRPVGIRYHLLSAYVSHELSQAQRDFVRAA